MTTTKIKTAPKKRGRKRLHPIDWMNKYMFDSKQARANGVVHRIIKSTSVEHDELTEEVNKRGFCLVMTKDRYVVFCNEAPLVIYR